MGPCRICAAPGCYGFSEPGPLSERRHTFTAWACSEHRAEVEANGSHGVDLRARAERLHNRNRAAARRYLRTHAALSRGSSYDL